MKLFANSKVVKRKPHTTSIDNLVPTVQLLLEGITYRKLIGLLRVNEKYILYKFLAIHACFGLVCGLTQLNLVRTIVHTLHSDWCSNDQGTNDSRVNICK